MVEAFRRVEARIKEVTGSTHTHTHTHTHMHTHVHFLKNQKTFSDTLGKEDHFICSHPQEVLTLRNKTLSAPSHRF